MCFDLASNSSDVAEEPISHITKMFVSIHASTDEVSGVMTFSVSVPGRSDVHRIGITVSRRARLSPNGFRLAHLGSMKINLSMRDVLMAGSDGTRHPDRRWTNGAPTGGRTDWRPVGRTDGRTDRRKDGRTNRRTGRNGM